jgi:hypothetical protein
VDSASSGIKGSQEAEKNGKTRERSFYLKLLVCPTFL